MIIEKMTIDEAIEHAEEVACKKRKEACNLYDTKNYEESRKCMWCAEECRQLAEWLKELKRLKEQEPCEMTAEEYRQRMIQAFHNTGTGELIALCVLPTEKEFEHLEWLLKNHYKKEPLKAWREKAIQALEQETCTLYNAREDIDKEEVSKAVVLLDLFTKTFCRYRNDYERFNDLKFRCEECPFQKENAVCLVKVFKCKYDPDYRDFGSMGNL